MKMHMGEILSTKREFSQYVNEITAKLQTLKMKTSAINKLQSFRGAAATSAKTYFATIHIELIEQLEETIKCLEENFIKIINTFNSMVDRSQYAIITEGYLDDLKQRTISNMENVLDIYNAEKQVNQQISDILVLKNYPVERFSSSIDESNRYLKKVNEDLFQFDQQASQIVKDSEEKIRSLLNKIKLYQINQTFSAGLSSQAVTAVNIKNDKSIYDYINSGIGQFRHILAGLNSTNKKLAFFYQSYIFFTMDKRQRINFLKSGRHSLNLAAYRRYNNLLRFNLYKMSTKEFIRHYVKNRAKGFPKGKMQTFKKIVVPYGKERGKLAMIREFDNLYGLKKFQEFKSLKTRSARALRIGKTFIDELAGKKINTTRNIVKNSSWKKPQTFLKNTFKEIKVSTKDTNVLGKGAKIIGKGLGPLSVGLHIRENIKENKGDTQKTIVGSVVDISVGSVSTAAGAAIGSAFLPPIGTVVGAGVGMGVSAGIHRKFGKPPRSIAERTKDLANKGVDSVVKATKKIGGKIASWFK